MAGGLRLSDGRLDGAARSHRNHRLPLPMTIVLVGLLLGVDPVALADPIPTAPAQNLSAAGQNARNPHVGVDVKGNAVVAW